MHLLAALVLGISLENYAYPYPVHYFPVNDGRTFQMAYMDVAPSAPSNGRTVVLMHGKNFGGYYFRNVIEKLSGAGYRVVVPDQIGWGKSPKADIHYSFQQLSMNIAVARNPDYNQWALASALAYQMIYQQPVRYVVIQNSGHIPHFEEPAAFFAALLPFLAS